jgi:hypothetical protein
VGAEQALTGKKKSFTGGIRMPMQIDRNQLFFLSAFQGWKPWFQGCFCQKFRIVKKLPRVST